MDGILIEKRNIRRFFIVRSFGNYFNVYPIYGVGAMLL